MSQINEILRERNSREISHIVIPSRPRADSIPSVTNQNFMEAILPDAPKTLNRHYPNTKLILPASSHTRATMPHPDNPDTTTKAHFIVFANVETSAINHPNFPYLNFNELSTYLTDGIQYLYKHTEKIPLVYALNGFPRPQSNKLLHWHEVVQTAPSSNKEDMTAREYLQYKAPLNHLFDDVLLGTIRDITTKPISVERYQIYPNNKAIQSYDLINTPIKTLVEEFPPEIFKLAQITTYTNPDNSDLNGIDIELPGEQNISEYLKCLYFISSKLNNIYCQVKEAFENIYCSDDEQRESIINSTLDNITKIGISKKNAQKIIKKGELFRPTLIQVEDWLKKPNLSSEARQRLEQTHQKYLRMKKLYSNQSFIEHEIKNGRELEVVFIQDMLLLPNEGNPTTTLPDGGFPHRLSIIVSHVGKHGEVTYSGGRIELQVGTIGNNMEANAKTIIKRK